MRGHNRNWTALVLCLAALFLAAGVILPATAGDAPMPDPSGANTGAITDIVGASAGAPTDNDIRQMSGKEPLAAKVGDVAGHNRIAINVVWTLVCGFLVMFMQAGFAMAETGFTRAKNAGHTMAMNFMVYGLGMFGFWVCGFALQMGGNAVGALREGKSQLRIGRNPQRNLRCQDSRHFRILAAEMQRRRGRPKGGAGAGVDGEGHGHGVAA